MPGVGEIVEPGEGEIAEIGQDGRPRRQIGHHRAGGHLLILGRVRVMLDADELLGAHIEERRELAGQQPPIALGDTPQVRQPARDLIEGGGIEGVDATGEGGQV